MTKIDLGIIIPILRCFVLLLLIYKINDNERRIKKLEAELAAKEPKAEPPKDVESYPSFAEE